MKKRKLDNLYKSMLKYVRKQLARLKALKINIKKITKTKTDKQYINLFKVQKPKQTHEQK